MACCSQAKVAPKEFECDIVIEDMLLSRCRFHGGSTLADARAELEMDREELGAIPRYFVFLMNGTTPLAPRHETDRSVYESLASGSRLYIKQDLNTRDDEMNNGAEQQYAPEQYNGTNDGMNGGMNGGEEQAEPPPDSKAKELERPTFSQRVRRGLRLDVSGCLAARPRNA